ncbi:MAG TPA: hypothetical protein VM406_10300, partial [Noviherbaspirillum sp.]|nr:hypothetical protein [Noviherbaspirillum sp.]
MKTVFSFAILVTALAGGPVLASSPAPAQQGQAQKKPAAASNAAKPQARKEAPARKAAAPEPDVAGMAAEPYDCDLG